MIIAVLSGYALALFIPFIFRLFRQLSGYVVALLPVSVFFYLCGFYPVVTSGEVLTFNYGWVPQIDLNMSFYLDGLSLIMALLISGFGAIICVYSASYLKGHQLLARFYIYLMLFMASMLGVVLSGNIIGLFVFWELTSLSSYLLIGFNHENETSRKAALQAMLITVGGGLCLLAAVILIGFVSETYEVQDLLTQNILHENALYPLIVVLLLLGALTKSAQFPFYFWLPNAMAAPTPVSAYLHSATMVKAGVYLVARFTPILGDSPLWENIILIAGTITMVLGGVRAVFENDLKKILAYTTLSALGMLFMTLGIGTPLAIKAAMAFLIAHAFYKGALFLLAGNIDQQTKSRDVNILGGLFKKMPWTGTAVLISSLSMAAVIPMFGFIAKEMVLEATLHAPAFAWIYTLGVVISGTAFVTVGILLGYKILFRRVANSEHVPESEVSFAMISGPFLLALFTLAMGLFSNQLISPILNQAFLGIFPSGDPFELGIWHGINTALILSGVTLLLGVLLYKFRTVIRRGDESLVALRKVSPQSAYFRALDVLYFAARKTTRLLQNGYLRSYISVILLVFVGLMLLVIVQNDLWSLLTSGWDHNLQDFRFYEGIVLILMVIATWMLFRSKSRLTAIVGLGIVGYGLGLIFVFFGAPDVAITQFLIETLTVILFVLVLHRLPEFRKFNRFKFEKAFVIIPIAFGALMTFILLLITNEQLVSDLKKYFVENSYTLGKGNNIVNVILVDFRALDTMGEITVLAIAALGIYALLNLKLDNKKIDE